MAFCVKCGNAVTKNVHLFCASCGATLEPSLPSDSELQQTKIEKDDSYEKRESKKGKAKKWVNGYALAGGGVAAAAIIPGATTAALYTLETTMVLHIGRIYKGDNFSKEDAIAVVGAAGFMGTIGLGSKMAMEGLNFFPVIGWAIKGGVAGSVIKTLGELIIKYFESIEEHRC
ncbi:MAG: hypothetical protein ABL950_00840 [Nitrospira sp.]